MTCIVGMLDKENDCAWMGGDSLGSSWIGKATYLQPKVFRHDIFKNVLMGVCGSYRNMDLLRYSDKLFNELDLYKNTELDHKFMVTKFIPNVINLFNDNIQKTKIEDKSVSFIICAKNKVFEVQHDYSVLEPMFGFCSVGSGSFYAEGSLYSTNDLDIPIPKRIELALEAAEQCGCSVQRPFTILNTKDEEVITII